MELSEYISSGVLELYALGALSSVEMNEVNQMCASHPEVARELASVQDALNNYSKAYGRNPRPELRAELMSKTTPADDKVRVVQFRSPHELTYKYLIAACIASLIISTFASVFFYQKWSESEDRFFTLATEKNVLAQNLSLAKYNYEKINRDLSVIRDPAFSIITLRATDSTKYYMAHVMWNKYTHQTYIDVADLPSPGDDKQYQLWALLGGQPIDAGVFEMTGDGGMLKVKPITDAEVWAVTLEPKGGSDSPAMDQMVLMSKS